MDEIEWYLVKTCLVPVQGQHPCYMLHTSLCVPFQIHHHLTLYQSSEWRFTQPPSKPVFQNPLKPSMKGSQWTRTSTRTPKTLLRGWNIPLFWLLHTGLHHLRPLTAEPQRLWGCRTRSPPLSPAFLLPLRHRCMSTHTFTEDPQSFSGSFSLSSFRV